MLKMKDLRVRIQNPEEVSKSLGNIGMLGHREPKKCFQLFCIPHYSITPVLHFQPSDSWLLSPVSLSFYDFNDLNA